MTHENYIGGRWVAAASGETDAVISPATGEMIAEVPSSTAADVDTAVAAARSAFEEWGGATPRTRSEALHRLTDGIEDNVDTLKALESQNVGTAACPTSAGSAR